MSKSKSSLFVLFLVVMFVASDVRGELVSVRVTGQSAISRDEAIRDAKRNAVEQGGLVHLVSQSKVINYELSKDMIMTRADGLVRSHDILSGPTQQPDGTWVVEIRAEVQKDQIEAEWSDVTFLMDQLGDPNIMIFSDDLKQSVGQAKPTPLSSKSPVTTRLMDVLLAYRFRIKDKSRFEALKGLNENSKDAYDLLRTEAASFGAQLYLEAQAIAEGPTPTTTQGFYKWNGTFWLKVYWSDTGEILLSVPLHHEEKNFRDQGDTGAIKLLDLLAEKAGQELRARLVEELMRRALDGGFVKVKIVGLEGRWRFVIEDYMKGLDRAIKDVRPLRGAGSAVVWEVKTTMLPSTLERALIEGPQGSGFAEFDLHSEQFEGDTMVLSVKPKARRR